MESRGTRFLLVIAGLLMLWARLPAVGAINAQTAVQETSAFAEAVGMPFGEGVETVMEAAEGPYGDRWTVKYFDFSEVTVDAADGSVVTAINRAAVEEFMAQPTTVAITEAAAVASASEIAKLMGLPFDSAELYDVELNEFAADELYQWHVRWVRTADGIPYESDMAIVMLDPNSGQFLGAGKAFWSSAPESVEVRVKESQALGIAREHAQRLGIQEADVPPSVELRIVQPNNYWGPGEVVAPKYGSPSRAAWVVNLRSPSSLGGEGAAADKVFWIDAANGELLGGTQSMGPTHISGAPSAQSRTSVSGKGGLFLPLVGAGGFVLVVTGSVLLRGRRRRLRIGSAR
ncbi:MAG: hypothetical protein JSW71_06295 [Gemmatimonadota bacterium]|nr:MAG: hypothetical protein JSW71_06295 [Gemmatimonadota bacterium]